MASAPVLLGVEVKLPATAAAGVDLAKIVLNILIWTVIALLGGYAILEIREGANASDIDAQIMRQAAQETDAIDPQAIEQLTSAFDNAAAKADAKATDEDRDALAALEDSLGHFRILSADQRKTLDACIPFPEGADRASKLKICSDELRLAGKAAKAANLDKLRTLIDFAKQIDASRQSFRSFWIQAAQLVLLNLLLPLLTGLFGYIFGTRQGGSNSNG